MTDGHSAPGLMLLGRRAERAMLDSLVDGARAGRSGALVLLGDAGIGKTALLEYAIESGSDLRTVRAAGVESEMELPFAALHQLCAPLLDRLDRLPEPQRDALATTFGLSAGGAPNRFLVGLAVLSLVSEVAEERPLLCAVDDAHWLDRASAQALGFVARRLLAEPVVLLIAARERSEDLRGLPDLVVGGLREADARELLSSAIRSPLDERVREQIVAETRGNPLALLELPRGLSLAQLAGGFGLPRALSLSGRIEERFLERFDALPEDTQRLLLVAAAEPAGDPALLWRAAEGLGIAGPVLEPAQSAGLLDVGVRVRFRHPLVRSAVYRSASPEKRREVHRALAEATDAEVDPDRRAWHLAEETSGPDETVAAELERAAGRAQARGGLAATAAFLERAAGLTDEPGRRAQRALAAAQAKHEAGAQDAALELLRTAQAGWLDELGRARVDLLRAEIAFASSHGNDAPPLLLAAAKRLEPLDVDLARATYLDALSAAQFAGRLAHGGGVEEVARAALAAPRPSKPARAADLLLDGLATLHTEGYAAGAPIVKRALAAFRSEDISSEEELGWLWLACRWAGVLWDDDSWDVLTARHLRIAREAGALTVLPLSLNIRIAADVFAGELAAATSLIEELQAIAEATGNSVPPYGPLLIAGWRGREAEASELIEGTIREVMARGEGLGVVAAEWARALVCNALGRYGDALAAAERACSHPEGLSFYNWALVELVAAAVAGEQPDSASGALERLSEMARASGTDWALGIEARSRALMSDGEVANRLYREAIERLRRTRVRVELARAHLFYGEWLRQERRRLDARDQLRTAREMFATIGAEAFAERAERELLASGERIRKRSVETEEQLTPQEAQIARLARDGLSNPEIGARLFISHRTVEYHLHKVFAKLGIASRNALERALRPETSAALR